MIILAESGSSKTDWIVIRSETDSESYQTIGLNPYHMGEEGIKRTLEKSDLAGLHPSEVVFFGAGCATSDSRAVVRKSLDSFWPGANIEVRHDMEGAAIACYDGRPCVVGILGTGSNACKYDGIAVESTIVAMGYLLGDEGGGAYFGRELLMRYFQNRLSEKMQSLMSNSFDLEVAKVKHRLYQEERPNYYLASFMPFIHSNKEDEEIAEILRHGFESYLQIYVAPLASSGDLPVHLVGSVAYYFEPEIRKSAAKLGLHIGRIIRQPLGGLVNWVLNRNARPGPV